MVKDMYADLEKIEARGKRKKEKSKGLFSSFGKKDEHEPDSEPAPQPTPAPPKSEPQPVPEPVKAQPVPQPQPAPQPQPVAEPEPAVQTPPPKPVEKVPEPVKSEPKPVLQAPPPEPENKWKPLTGGKLKKAEEDLLAYKKWLNKGYKSGVLTKDQCNTMVRTKEVELGLRPPE